MLHLTRAGFVAPGIRTEGLFVPSRATHDLNDLLRMPFVQELVARGRRRGSVTAQELRDAVTAADIPATSQQGLLSLLREQGVTVAEDTDVSGRKKVAAAAASRTTVMRVPMLRPKYRSGCSATQRSRSMALSIIQPLKCPQATARK